MTRTPILLRLLVVSSAACAPLCAQTPLFTDGSTFGGSQVFSEGLNPNGNPARIGQAPAGYYLSFVDGDQRAKDNKSILSTINSSSGSAASAALGQLANAPWAQHTRAYGFAATKSASSLTLTREELNGLLASTDLNAADLGAGLGANGSTLTATRAVVNRLGLGCGAPVDSGIAAGLNLRVESWQEGQQTASYASFSGFSNAEGMLDSSTTTDRTLALGLDGGVVFDVATGVRLGATATQLNAKRLWNVDQKPQFRAGLQLDLGSQVKVSLESDINSAERMPFPVKQQTADASLRYAISQAAVFILGVEQKKIAGDSINTAGATLQIRTSSLLLSFGFQAGQDSPMKSATLGFL